MSIDEIIIRALSEDIGNGDHTTLATMPTHTPGQARLLVKDNGILCGIDVAEKVFHAVDPRLKMNVFLQDATAVSAGDIAFNITGQKASILQAERVVLNFMQRLSGIATATHQAVEKLSGLKTKLLDTRKTTPLLRELEKYAVRCGGGHNHRMGLYDMIMIKDNHVDYAGGIKNAIDAVHKYMDINNKILKVEIEVRNFEELNLVLQYGKVNRIMLDNFKVTDLQEAVNVIDGRFETEASGGITIDNLRDYAKTGVDYISMGALTHQIKSLDMSLKAERIDLPAQRP